ncbi:sensor histidine kinase [Paenibacillus sp. MMO-177]|uniref:sensor histidine kinase n=1 Tax=Paenibacillus sp. MMO-177 TaxID=3081289 RepID=UPI003017D418
MKTVKANIFIKLLVMLILLLCPIVILYGYSNNTSVNVIKSQIQQLNLNRLSFFNSQIEEEAQRLVMLSSVISRDYSVQSLQVGADFSSYVEISSLNAVEQKLRLQQIASKWDSRILVYYPQVGRVVPETLAQANPLNLEELPLLEQKTWVLELNPAANGTQALRFAHYVIDPYLADARNVQQITKIYFSMNTLRDLLDNYNRNQDGETLLYHPGHGFLSNNLKGAPYSNELLKYLGDNLNHVKANQIVAFDGDTYVLNALKLQSLDCYLIDIVPIHAILSPITKSRNLFYGSIVALVVFGIAASLWLYRFIRLPMKQLLQGVRKVRNGDYSVRIPERRDSDFGYLLEGFNYMAADIQELIEKVYAEQLHTKEAKLKQLQSQINPHFLYNCLFYIMNMATLGDEEAVVAMSLNLGEYFRYTTQSDKEYATVDEEIRFVRNYLNIQQLRMKRLRFDIDLQEDLLKQSLPRLSVQPIVENAVIHGIEPQPEGGTIHIRGFREHDWNTIIIEDTGRGMTREKLEALRDTLSKEHDDNRGYGVWNVHQRLALQYGANSGLEIHSTTSGGMQFILRWQHS